MSMGRGGIFGNPDWTPKRGGMFGVAQESSPWGDMVQLRGIQGPRASDALPDRKPGFFGEGGMGRMIAGFLGDALMQQNGFQPLYAPMMAQRQDNAFRAKQAEAKRMADREDFLFQQEWKRDNPEPRQPYRWESNNGSLMEIGPDGVPRTVYADPTPKMNFIPDGMGGGQWVAVPTAAPAKMASPAPSLDDWNSAKPMGGSQSGPVPFAANPPARLQGGVMTSGRRTVEGNRAVGGVPNSKHLTGEAVDYSGPDLNALLAEARKLPGLRRAFIHNGNHVHAEGNWNAPYFGKNGTKGR